MKSNSLMTESVCGLPPGAFSAGVSYSLALQALQDGAIIAREGWNGKGMYLFLVPEKEADPFDPLPFRKCLKTHAYIAMKTAQGYVIPWVASQADGLTKDWAIAKSVDYLNLGLYKWAQSREIVDDMKARGVVK